MDNLECLLSLEDLQENLEYLESIDRLKNLEPKDFKEATVAKELRKSLKSKGVNTKEFQTIYGVWRFCRA